MRNYWEGTGEPGISSEGDEFDNRQIAVNDNGTTTLTDATIAQLLRAVRGKIDSQPANLRPMINQLVRSRLVYLLDEGPAMSTPNLRLITTPDFQDAALAYDALIKRAQDILAAHLPPYGISADQTVSELLGLLDGAPWREARDKYAAALAKAAVRS